MTITRKKPLPPQHAEQTLCWVNSNVLPLGSIEPVTTLDDETIEALGLCREDYDSELRWAKHYDDKLQHATKELEIALGRGDKFEMDCDSFRAETERLAKELAVANSALGIANEALRRSSAECEKWTGRAEIGRERIAALESQLGEQDAAHARRKELLTAQGRRLAECEAVVEAARKVADISVAPCTNYGEFITARDEAASALRPLLAALDALPPPPGTTCAHREHLPTDEDFSTGPECGKPATHLNCDPIDSPSCAEHKCRCNKVKPAPPPVADSPAGAAAPEAGDAKVETEASDAPRVGERIISRDTNGDPLVAVVVEPGAAFAGGPRKTIITRLRAVAEEQSGFMAKASLLEAAAHIELLHARPDPSAAIEAATREVAEAVLKALPACHCGKPARWSSRSGESHYCEEHCTKSQYGVWWLNALDLCNRILSPGGVEG